MSLRVPSRAGYGVSGPDHGPGRQCPAPSQRWRGWGRLISPGPGARVEHQTPERQEKAAACVAMDIQRHDQMLLFLALQCQFMGGVLGTHREGRKAPESGFCPAQVAREHSGVPVDDPRPGAATAPGEGRGKGTGGGGLPAGDSRGHGRGSTVRVRFLAKGERR